MTPIPRRMSRFFSCSVLNKTAASGLLVALLSMPALADDFADVSRFMRNGQHAEALARADAFLARHPRDAQMRFLKGVILTEQNKTAEAIAIFTRLTEDHPRLPEPYNNLAVLHAASGQYEKARAALDAAIRTNPSYATAYENLGDVHAKLASQAYDKALQLDSGNSAAKSKLTLVRSLVGGLNDAGKAAEQSVAAAPAIPVLPKPSAPPPQQPPATPAAKPVEQAAAKPEPAKAAARQPEQLALAKPEAAKSEAAKPAAPKQAVNTAERKEVIDVVEDWAKAWSARDVKSYLSYYGSDFQTPGKQTRKAWEDDRRARIVGKGRIDVRVESPEASINGNTATVKFRQVYLSDRLTANTRKTLVLTRQGGKWKIKQESTGN